MTFKLLATDLDDTLLNDACLISQRTKDVIRRAKEKGVLFTFATGRMYRSALPFALDLEIDVPLITYHGALIKTSVTKEVLYHRPLSVELAKEVVAIGQEEGLSTNVYLDDELFIHRMSEKAREYCRLAQVPFREAEDLTSILDRDPTKVLFIGEVEHLNRLWSQLSRKFGNNIYITKSKPHYLEFTHPQATKGHGLKALAQALGIQKEEIIAFGDSYNDLELLRAAGFAVAMGNALAELKQEADYITGTNNEDGVAEAIEKLVLNNIC